MPPDDDFRQQLADLTATVGDLGKVVAGLVKMAADETIPASQSGTAAARDRAQFLRQATDVCRSADDRLEQLRRQLTD